MKEHLIDKIVKLKIRTLLQDKKNSVSLKPSDKDSLLEALVRRCSVKKCS